MLSHRAWPHRLSPSTTTILTRTATTLARAQSEESGIEPGPIATITGSFVSFGDHVALDQYDTDHTDLGSEADESEVKRGLLRDQWRQFFDQFDPEGFGEILWPDFLNVMDQQEFRERVNTGKRQILLEKSRTATTPAITFQDFVNVEEDQSSKNGSNHNVSSSTKGDQVDPPAVDLDIEDIEYKLEHYKYLDKEMSKLYRMKKRYVFAKLNEWDNISEQKGDNISIKDQQDETLKVLFDATKKSKKK